MEQVNCLGGAITSIGAALSCFTSIATVLEQPVLVSVIVKTYVPGWFTIGLKVLLPETIFPGFAVQPNVVPACSGFPYKVTVDMLQFKVSGYGSKSKVGLSSDVVTGILALWVHPVLGSVTVSVYIPAASIVALNVFETEII